MSVMRLTMIVHYESGDEQGDQEAVMKVCDLPDTIDPGEARELMNGLAGHIGDELKRIAESGEQVATRKAVIGSLRLTASDIDTIVDGIENFIIGPVEDKELDGIWRPYINKLNALRSVVPIGGE